MITKAERIAKLLNIISNKSERIKKLKLECGQQATKICLLNERIKKLEAKSIDCPNRPASKTEIEMAKRLCDYQDEVHNLKQRIKGLEVGQLDFAKEMEKILKTKIQRIEGLEKIMQRCVDAMKGSNCLEEQWLSKALEGK